MTRALILAAGRGSRLGSLTDECPKGLVKLKGKSLVSRALETMTAAGIEEVAIATGYKSEMFGEFNKQTYLNANWDKTNMVSSLLAADTWLAEERTIVSYSDIFYAPDILCSLMSHEGDVVITADRSWELLWRKRNDDFLADAESFRTENGKLKDIGRQPVELREIEAQYMGLVSISARGWKGIRNYLLSISDDCVAKLSMTDLLMEWVRQGNAVDVCFIDGQWGEVDTPSDLNLYEKMVNSGEIGDWF
ncbi:NTP transferase domain-containing protein [Owenweeksia hongkongensis]|uniref:phosphocholine cytidylyltransferase family protein n=1 Tax=Owenweeksia hongkongensis TaxID=253245 RepID=UPI003A8DCF06